MTAATTPARIIKGVREQVRACYVEVHGAIPLAQGEQGGAHRRGARRANAMRRAPFGTANEVADRDMRWYLDEHVEVSL